MRYLHVIVVLLVSSVIADCFHAIETSQACFAETTRRDASPEKVQQLIRRLGARRYAARQRAEAELRHIGPEAVDQLLEAQYDSTHEISLAAQQILCSLKVNWTRPNENSIIAKILGDYDDLNDGQRVARATWLSKLEDGIGIPAILRIARYDQSDVTAKQAALNLIENFDRHQPDQIELLSKAMQDVSYAQRTSLQWLRAFHRDVLAEASFELNEDHQADRSRLKDWHELARLENALTDSPRSTPEIREAINKRVAGMALALVKENATLAETNAKESIEQTIAGQALDTLVENVQDAPSSIIDLGRWLLDAEQVAVFEEKIWKPFQKLRESQPQFTYLAAEAFAKDVDQSQQLADEAFNIYTNPPRLNDSEDNDNSLPEADQLVDEVEYMDPLVVVFAQINTAIALENRGLTEWAIREYRRIMENTSEHWRVSIVREQATVILSELLHDRGRDAEAADVLATLVGKQANNVFGNDDLGDQASFTSRMHYFRSEHYRKEADREKQIEYLRKAVEADPTDADVLIAMHRLPRADEKWKAETKRYIDNAVKGFELIIQREMAAGEILNRADVSKNLNQVAWLVGNTEGDFEKAIRQSRRSLELRPGSAGSLDTLGRTYFAVGDFENALKYQRRAAKMEPHSQQIARQLAEFEMAASKGAAGVEPTSNSSKEGATR